MAKELGCCGSTIRFFLILMNLLLFVASAAVFGLGLALRYSDLAERFQQLSSLGDVVLNSATLNIALLGIIILSGFVMVLSIIGLIGSSCTSKFFLFIYQVVVVILFLAHGIGLIVGIFSSSTVEEKYREVVNNTFSTLNKPDISGAKFNQSCAISKSLSELFSCCGNLRGAEDFNNEAIVPQCCAVDPSNGMVLNEKVGCSEAGVNFVSSRAVWFIMIPSAVVLGLELCLIIGVPLLIGNISKAIRKRREANRSQPKYRY